MAEDSGCLRVRNPTGLTRAACCVVRVVLNLFRIGERLPKKEQGVPLWSYAVNTALRAGEANANNAERPPFMHFI